MQEAIHILSQTQAGTLAKEKAAIELEMLYIRSKISYRVYQAFETLLAAIQIEETVEFAD